MTLCGAFDRHLCETERSENGSMYDTFPKPAKVYVLCYLDVPSTVIAWIFSSDKGPLAGIL